MDKAQFKLVPVEPTDSMVQAAHNIDLSYMPGQEGADRAAIYRAMLAAAPEMIADVTPPPTSRDRWFYQQGWIAHEREAAPQPPSASGERDVLNRLATLDTGNHFYTQVEVQLIKDARAALAPSPGIDAAEQKRHPLQAYADSYAMMVRMGEKQGVEATVSARSVMYDIRNNMIPATVAAPLAARPSAEWLAEAERLVDAYAKEFAQGPPSARPTRIREGRTNPLNRPTLEGRIMTEQWVTEAERLIELYRVAVEEQAYEHEAAWDQKCIDKAEEAARNALAALLTHIRKAS